MMKAKKICKDGIHFGNIGETIQKPVESEGFSVVQDFCGHGIAKTFHKEPMFFIMVNPKLVKKYKTKKSSNRFKLKSNQQN